MPRPRNAFLILLALTAMTMPPVARAQPSDDVTAHLTAFAPWTAPDRPLVVTLEIANGGTTPLEEISIRLTIRDRVRSRSALRVALDREPQGSILAVTTEELATPLNPGERTTITVQRDLGSLATPFVAGRGTSGVYPMSIRVQAGEDVVADRFGAFVFLAQPPETQLNVVWVLPIHRPTAMDAGGAYDRTQLARDLLDDGVLRATIEMLERNPAAALTLAPSGQLVDQLLDLSDGFLARVDEETIAVPATDPIAVAAGDLLARLGPAVASPAYELATMPYARANLVSLIGADMAFDAGQQVILSRARVAELLGREPNAALLVNAGYAADARSARPLAALGARAMILDPDALREVPQGRFGNPDRPEEVVATGVSFEALLIDDPVRQRLQTPTDDPVLSAMGIVAETAVSYFEVPGLAPARTLVIASDVLPSPDIADPLLGALANAPWARLRSATSTLADPALSPSSEPLRLGSTRAVIPDRLTTAQGARRMVEILERVVDAPGLLGELQRRILISQSADLRAPVAEEFAAGVRSAAGETLDAISVPPRRVTLTSRGGRVPVTVVNETGFPVRVRIRLHSAKVAFPEGASRRISVEGGADRQTLTTVTFDLEARTAGSFPIDVRIETPDGDNQIGSSQLLVRSTAVSAVTFAATAGGVLFLLGAWVRRFLRRPRTDPSG